MELFLFAILMVINLAISTWNAWICGRMWILAEGAGQKILLWCGLIQSVIGYSMFGLIGLLLGGHYAGQFDEEVIKASFQLWYLAAIFPVITTGFVIWLHSVWNAIKNPSVGTVAAAGWNTFAMYRNVSNAITMVPEASKGLRQAFKSTKLRGKAGAIILIVALALLFGIICTYGVFSLARSRTYKQLNQLSESAA